MTDTPAALPSTPASLLPIVLQAMSRAPDARTCEVVGALVRHLHQFVIETQLSEREFEFALDFVNRIGQATNAKNNEAVLVADLLGVSSLVALQANADAHGLSDAALLGPFWRAGAAFMPAGASIAMPGTPGAVLEVRGTLRDAAGKPVVGATLDVWQASPKGLYENQDPEQPAMNLRGRFQSDDAGGYFFCSVRPAGYPVPTGGPGGELLRAQLRQPYRPAHLHFMISKPGFKVLITQLYPRDAEQLHSDPTFGVTQRLVADFHSVQRDGVEVIALTHNFTLLDGEMVLPAPPIA